ncbi:MAG: isoprenylcysteine carboxylmethyltransferase family protein [Thermoplasmatales archaeon]|nr:isoprenylcysteine carboxylmethyltransferase family protein [Thermoplasmatales archaeon]
MEVTNMWMYIICAGIWIGFILHWITSSIPKRRIFEIYAGCSISICLTLLIFGLFGWYQEEISQVLQVIGSILICITIALALITFVTFRSKGKPKKGIEETTVLIKGTIFGVIRHPLYLGFALWGIGQILVIQTVVSTILGIVAIFCSWMASRKEDEFNIKKFGDSYREYMKKVPMWNVFKRLKK